MPFNRKLEPVKSYEGLTHPLNQRQFHWVERDQGLFTALFAGKEMMICLNDNEASYQLTYLDMAHSREFASVEEAKAEAQVFAQSVLTQMMKINGIPESEKDDPLYKHL
jgi:hypothetical protein